MEFLKELKDESLIFGDHLLLPGKKISDLIKKDNYEIKHLTKEGVILEHKTYFRSEQKKDIEIGYDELVIAFESDHFSIDGFMPSQEGEQKNVVALKKVILNTIKNIELEQRELEIKDRENRLSLTEQALAQSEDEKKSFSEKIINKRKSKKLAKTIRSEEERIISQETARKSFEQEQDRRRIEREKTIKLASAKSTAQQQRARVIARENFIKKEENGNN